MNDTLLVKPNKVAPYFTLPLGEKFVYVKEIFINAIPTISAFLNPLLINLISLYFLADYGQDELVGGYGLGAMFSSVFAIAWVISFNQAANVFISQAFGAQDYIGCNRFFRRGLIILGLLLLPLCVSLMAAENIMLLCGVDEKLAAFAGTFTRLSIPFTIGNAFFDSMKSFVVGQKVYQPIFYIQSTTLCLHFLWAYIFIHVLQLGIYGAVICRTLEEWTNAFLVYMYIQKSGKFTLTWLGWDKEIFNMQELWKQFKFAFNIAIITYISWIYFEIQTLMAGSFSARQVVVHIAIGNTSSILYTVALGISVTLITMMGNSLGERNLTKAKNYVYAGLTLLSGLTVIFIVVFLAILEPWATFWTIDPETQKILRKTVLAYIIGTMMADGVNNGLVATLKSVGKEKQAMFGVFFSLYIVSIPLMVIMAYLLDWQVLGVWVAFSCGNVILFCIHAYNFGKIDWEAVQKRIEQKPASVELERI